MDAAVAPALSGAELFTVLRSRLSPQEIRYRVVVPAGAILSGAAGGAVISGAGRVLARVPAPVARDAQGSPVPVGMRVVGGELLLDVAHRSRDVAYPVLVDPTVIVITESTEKWSFANNNQSCEGQITGGAPGAITAPETTFPHENCNKPGGTIYKTHGYWKWVAPSSPLPPSKIFTVEYDNVAFSANVTKGTWGAHWSFSASCGEGFGSKGGYNREPPPSTVVIRLGGECSETGNRTVEDQLEIGALNGEGTNKVTVSASLSVGAILISSEWSPPLLSKGYGPGSGGEPNRARCLLGHPVNCATGNQIESQTDLAVGGRGPGLHLTRTYNSQLAASQSTPGPFGYGWTGPYSAHLVVDGAHETATVYQDNGSSVTFDLQSGKYVGATPLVQATLVKEGTSYVYTLPDQTKLQFNSAGQLTSETDRNGNVITMSLSGEGRLESVSDAAGRKLTFSYNAEGQVESVKDPLGHTVKYTYEGGNLASVTQPGEASLRWQFQYDTSHQMTSETDGRSHAVTTEYDTSHRVIVQKDAMERTRKWKYVVTEAGTETTVTEPNGAVTVEKFNGTELPTSITHASGTAYAATTTYEYDGSENLIAVTDPNKHTTKYGYSAAGDRTSSKDANGNETKWTYSTTHDLETTTTPKGEKTTIKRDTHGNPEVIERPAPSSKVQKTTYKYDTQGDVIEATDPLENKTKYEYDTYGDRESETTPTGDKRTWGYNEDSQETSTVSPRGHVKAGEEAKYTTKTERDAQGRPLTVTDPLGHTTKYTYDGNGNLETLTDGNAHKTTYTYDADDEQTKIEKPNGQIIETGYDSAGQPTSQTDGNKHTTKYERNLLEQITEEVDPLSRKTTKEYDLAGNLKMLTDPAKRTTTYAYDLGNRLTEVIYSSGKPATVKYEYDKDSDRTKMTDGTGTNKYTYDQLDRLLETENGNKEKVKYEYDLRNSQTKITYPNTKAVTRAFDKDGRLEKVTD